MWAFRVSDFQLGDCAVGEDVQTQLFSALKKTNGHETLIGQNCSARQIPINLFLRPAVMRLLYKSSIGHAPRRQTANDENIGWSMRGTIYSTAPLATDTKVSNNIRN